MSHPSQQTACWYLSFRTPHSAPHFTTQTSCPTNTGCMQWSTRRSNDRKRAKTTPRVEERLDCQGTDVARVWGSPWDVERAPRKLGWWGAKRVSGKGDTTHDIGFQLSTIYANRLQDFLHFHNETCGYYEPCSSNEC